MSLEQALAQSKENAKQVEVLTKSVNDLITLAKKTPANGQPHPGQVFGTPAVRYGEDPMTSRGFSFMKMLGVLTGAIGPEDAKVEMDIHNRMHNAFIRDAGPNGYTWGARSGIPGVVGGKFLAPLATNFLHDAFVDNNFRREMKSLVSHGVNGADPDEMNWIKRKQWAAQGYNTKALSWLNELTGGALVAPPEMGELIELLRNKEALVNAGARVVPLPPQGRLKYPRQTAASNTYWVGENSPITESLIGTGEVTLQAKKLAVLIKAPNELIRFASPAAEALLRDDMTKSLALGLDLAGLEGQGGDNRPRGIINMQNINRINSSQQNANGDAITGKDIYRFIAAIEESNAEFEAFVMRPKTLYKYYQLRADSVAQGDQAGAFLFNLIREAQDGAVATLAGFPVIKSTQVSQTRTKGAQSNLTYIVGGMWSDLLIGMFGAIEFAATTMGDTAFVNDQTWVRGILSADIQARHEAAFFVCDTLDTTI
jgi:HK97 family phage major capsid protein